MLHQHVGDASLTIEPEHGGRISSLVVAGHELLAPRVDNELTWGCYPMVPWAGRVREGRFRFDGTEHHLECDVPPHAIHGVGHKNPWTMVDDTTLRLDMTGLWPFDGTVEQTFDLEPGSLNVVLIVTAVERPMPAIVGWHPCFRRQLEAGGPVELDFEPGFMWERDRTGIPTGRRIGVPPRPWDDCFGDVARPPRLIWPGAVELEIESDCASWVVYDEQPDLICVEPQSDAPDAFNRQPLVIAPGCSHTATMTLRW